MTSLREPWRQLIRSSPSCPSLRASLFFLPAPTASLCVSALCDGGPEYKHSVKEGGKKKTRIFFIKVFGQFGFWFSVHICRLPQRINAPAPWRSVCFSSLKLPRWGNTALPSRVAPSKSTFGGKFKDRLCFDFFFAFFGGVEGSRNLWRLIIQTNN